MRRLAGKTSIRSSLILTLYGIMVTVESLDTAKSMSSLEEALIPESHRVGNKRCDRICEICEMFLAQIGT